MQQVETEESIPSILKMYNSSFKSKATAISYTYMLKKYAGGDDEDSLQSLLTLNQKQAEDKLIQFIITNKEKGMNWGALHNYLAAVVKFYSINGDIELNVKRIKRFMPEPTTLKKDRGYETPEIQSILDLCTERTKSLILLLCSSGARLGAIAGAKISDLEDKGGDIYKITYYPNTKQEYFSYCSVEARKALTNYFSIRERHGESINQKSPVIREQYNVENPIAIRYPKQCTVGTLAKVINQVLERAGLRTRMSKTEASRNTNTIFNKDIQLTRGFRKFFNTQLANTDGVNPLVKELLMGHTIGLDDSYFRPKEDTIEQQYRLAIDALTIDPTKRLQKKVETLELERSQFDQLAAKIQSLEAKIDDNNNK